MGQKGPLSKFGGYGEFGAAYSGFCNLLGRPDRMPLPVVNAHTDFISPWYIVMTVIGALLHRRKTGEGMCLDQSQIEAGVTFLGPQMLDYFANGRIARRMGNHDPYWTPHSVYPCLGEDRWIAVTVTNEEEWKQLCHVMGSPDLMEDLKFATVSSRKENEDELDEIIGQWSKDFLPHQLMAILSKCRCSGRGGPIRRGSFKRSPNEKKEAFPLSSPRGHRHPCL